MGEVYRARDPRLERDVALKVLPGNAAADPEQLARLQREARAVASLNHPHILAVYDIGSDQGVGYVVFELLEGVTLRQRLESGALPARKVVDYGVQICQGLAAAHDRGVVHRDLKPANLFLTARGQVKILDFGLARQTVAADPNDLPQAETRTAETQSRRVVGTAGYMSPEQARGERADARSDLFALGAILYEMLSGRRAFHGPSSVDTLAAVLRSDPPEIETDGVPPGLERVVRRCLEKNPGERFQSAHDLGLALETLSSPGPPSFDRKQRLRMRRRATAGGVVALGILAAAAGAWWLWSREPRGPTDPVRIVPFTSDGGFKYTPRLSPDGERVAYSWGGRDDENRDIYVKGIGPGTKPLRLTQHKATDWGPVWSPDGRQIAFVREFEKGKGAAIYTVPSLGGQERRLVDAAGLTKSTLDDEPVLTSLSWSADGEWLALSEKPGEDAPARIVRLSLATLEKTPLTSPPADSFGDLYPELSPDGRLLAFVRSPSRLWGNQDVWVQPLHQPGARQLTFAKHNHCTGLAWTPDGKYVIFSTGNGLQSGGRILRVPVAGGDSTPLAGVGDDSAWPSVRGGRMVHAQMATTPWAIWRIPGRRSSLAERKPEKLIASQWDDEGARYSPDGHRLAFSSRRSGHYAVWVSNSDGSDPVQLTSFDSLIGTGGAPWSPDGRRIVISGDVSGNQDVYLVDVEGGVPQRLTHEPSTEFAEGFSRDGRFVYFSSDRTGLSQIWRMPVGGGPAIQATQGWGHRATESWDGRFLYYWHPGGEIWRVPVAGGDETPVVRGIDFLAGWDLSSAGIYYASSRGTGPFSQEYTIRYLDLQSGHTETLFKREGSFWHWSLGVSPDEKWILYGEQPAPQSELMLIENFR
jgi:Tol biopolymer transport system component